MARLALILFSMLLSVAAFGVSTPDSIMSRRADRAYEGGEWTSAQTLYMILADRQPDDARVAARVISAGLMRGDTAAAMPAIERALAAGTPVDSLIGGLKAEAFALGRIDLYEHTLHAMADELPYLRRPINARLLAYYRFRNDAESVIRYATMLQAGVADDARYLNPMAWAYATEGDVDRAVELWRRVLTIEPDNVEALLSAGNALSATKPDEALPLLRRALELRPTPYLRKLVEELGGRIYKQAR